MRPINDRFSGAITMFAAGLGSDYPNNPYARFGAEGRGGLTLAQSGVSGMLAWRALDTQAVGFGVNLSYREFAVKGIQPFAALSEDPEHVTDNDRDGGSASACRSAGRVSFCPA